MGSGSRPYYMGPANDPNDPNAPDLWELAECETCKGTGKINDLL